MPLYIGTLSAAEQPKPISTVPAAAKQSQPVDRSSSSDIPANGTTVPPNSTPSSNVAPVEEVPWMPSAGRKIDTGLSIVLENVASGFTRPNVLDVKLGARLWADDAPPSKRARLDEVAQQTTSGSLGFRIAGMKVWTGVNGENDAGGRTDPYETEREGFEGAKGEIIEKHGYRRYDRWYGRSFNSNNVKEGFETFLGGAKVGKIDRSRLVAKRLAEGIQRMQSVLEAEESRMYSSSILVVYEGDPEAMENSLEEEKRAAEDPGKQAKEEEDDDEDDDYEEIDLEQAGSLVQVADIKDITAANGLGLALPDQAININVDPGSAQLTGLEEDDDDDDDEEEEEAPPKVLDLRLIDFAHAQWTAGQGPDENVLMGIRSLVKIFSEIAGD